MAGSALRTHANPLREALDSVQPKPARVRTAAKNDEIRRDSRKSAELVREVMRSVDLSQKAFAVNADQPESVVSESLNGQRNLAFDWMDAQDDTFVAAFAQAWLESRQLSPQNQRSARVKLAATLFQQLIDLVEQA